jgi:hypothetical protein
MRNENWDFDFDEVIGGRIKTTTLVYVEKVIRLDQEGLILGTLLRHEEKGCIGSSFQSVQTQTL